MKYFLVDNPVFHSEVVDLLTYPHNSDFIQLECYTIWNKYMPNYISKIDSLRRWNEIWIYQMVSVMM